MVGLKNVLNDHVFDVVVIALGCLVVFYVDFVAGHVMELVKTLDDGMRNVDPNGVVFDHQDRNEYGELVDVYVNVASNQPKSNEIFY